MSWISRLLFGPPSSASAVLGAANLQLVSPYASSSALALVYSDTYGPSGIDAVTRDSAMTVAPIARGRGVIVGQLADLPFQLGAYDAAGEFVPDATQPAWLTSTATIQTAWHRFALSLDDVIFTGWCLWVVDRDEAGTIQDAARLARHRWSFDAASPTGIRIDDKPVPNSEAANLILFAGPHEGLLTVAAESIRGWRAMESAWVGRVRNPIPLMVLHEKTENGVRQEDAQAIVDAFADNRTSVNGAVGWLPATIELEVHGEVSADLFLEGRNAARIDMANHLNLPVTILDGSTATASLTYSTQEGTHSQLQDDLDYWIAPFEARLSAADVSGPGKVIRLARASNSAAPNDAYGPERGDADPEPTAPAQEAPNV